MLQSPFGLKSFPMSSSSPSSSSISFHDPNLFFPPEDHENFVFCTDFSKATVPIIIVSTHGGHGKLIDSSTRSRGCLFGDDWLRQLCLGTLNAMMRTDLSETTKISPIFISCDAHRLYVDTNRGLLNEAAHECCVFPADPHISKIPPVEPEPDGHPMSSARRVYNTFHEKIEQACEHLRQKLKQKVLVFDMHGNAKERLEGQIYACTAKGKASRTWEFLHKEISLHLNAQPGLSVFPVERASGDAVYTGGFVLHRYGRELHESINACHLEIHRSYRRNVEEAFETGCQIGNAIAQLVLNNKETLNVKEE